MSAVSSQLLCTAGDASTRTATRARALPHRRRRRRGCRPSRCSRGDPRPRGPPRACSRRAFHALSRARRLGVPSSSSPPAPSSRARPRRVSVPRRDRAPARHRPALPQATGRTRGRRLGPPPRLTREPSSRASRPRRFGTTHRRILRRPSRHPKASRARTTTTTDGPDPRELARGATPSATESSPRIASEYLVAVIRRELGRPQALLAADAAIRQALRRPLRGAQKLRF